MDSELNSPKILLFFILTCTTTCKGDPSAYHKVIPSKVIE